MYTENIDCGNAHCQAPKAPWTVARMETPTRQNVDTSSTWLFDEEFGDDIINPEFADELDSPSSSVVEKSSDAPPTAVSLIVQRLFLQNVFDSASYNFPELAFTMAVEAGNSSAPVLTITQKNLYTHPPFGLTSRIQVAVQYKNYTASVLMRTWKVGEVKSVEDIIELCHDFSNKSVYKFCPGIDPHYYEDEYHKIIRFHIKSVRFSQFPFMRVDSVNCKLWFIPASNIPAVEKSANEVKCPA